MRVFSGIQPTGNGVPHIGNYLGAMKRFPLMTGEHRTDALFCVVDLHATTTAYNPQTLRESSMVTAASLLASGVNPERAVVFRQSAVQEHAYLGLLLGHLSRLGELERMTQFKDKGRGHNRESVPTGLLTYPVLMAADILLYKTTHVPVGKDQHQHMQLAAELAARFNRVYKTSMFPIPQGVGLDEDTARIMSLREPLRKMSKSEPDGAVFLTDTRDEAARKFRKAVSETEPLPGEPEGLENRPAASALVSMLSAFTGEPVSSVLSRLGGAGFSRLKEELAEAFEHFIVPVGNEMRRLLNERKQLEEILNFGEDTARSIAQEVMQEVRNVAGLA